MTRSEWLSSQLAELAPGLVVGLAILLTLLFVALRIGVASAPRQPGFVALNLVLRRYEINPDDAMNLVHMVGRKAGFWGWLWSELKIAKTYEMHVSARFIMIIAPGIHDGIVAVIPMGAIVTAAVCYAYYLARRAIRVLVSAGEGYWGFRYRVGAAGSFEKAAETVSLIRNLIAERAAEPSRIASGHMRQSG